MDLLATLRRHPRRLLLMLTLLIVGMVMPISGQWTSMNDRKDARVILAGMWESCPDDDGEYVERVYEHVDPRGVKEWELHLGPRSEFALFAAPFVGEHQAHDTNANRLFPAYRYEDVQTKVGGRNWSALGLHLNVVKAGGSREDCYSFVLLLEADRALQRVAR